MSIDKDCTDLKGNHKEEVFFNCTFKDLRGLVLEKCDLNHSKFVTSDIRELLGFTVTLDCHSFGNVELSPLIFDMILSLLLKTKGNDEKRRKILNDVLGRDRAYELLKQMEGLE